MSFISQIFDEIKEISNVIADYDRKSNGWLTTIMCIVTLCFRKFEAIINPQFWAEDGTVFFVDAYNQGVECIFNAYAGYLHTYPRLTSIIASYFPIEIAPYIYNGSSILLIVFIVRFILSNNLHLRNKLFICLFLCALPHSNEVIINLTNTNWWLAIFLGLFFFLKKDSKISAGYKILFIVACLSGPFAIILFPLYILHLRRNLLDKNSVFIIFFSFLGLVISLAFLISNPSSIENRKSFFAIINVFLEVLLTRNYFFLDFENNFLDKIQIILINLIIIYSFFILRFKNSLPYLYFFIFAISVVFAACIKASDHNYLDMLVIYPLGDRYMWVLNASYLLLILSLPITGNKRTLSIILILISFISQNKFFTHKELAFQQFNWYDFTSELQKNNYVKIPINPIGWFIELGNKSSDKLKLSSEILVDSDKLFISNISSRCFLQNNEQLILGFTLDGKEDSKGIFEISSFIPNEFKTNRNLGYLNSPKISLFDQNVEILSSESNFLETELTPGTYSIILQAADNDSGVALIGLSTKENSGNKNLEISNFSVRGRTYVNEKNLIAGFILSGNTDEYSQITAQCLGPSISLNPYNIKGTIKDPTLLLIHENQSLFVNNWQESDSVSRLKFLKREPSDSLEAAHVFNASSGSFSIIAGDVNNESGIALVQVFKE